MYDIAIFGATFAAAGFLKAYRGNTIVIERNTLCGYEFINALKMGSDYEIKPRTAEGKSFAQSLKGTGVLKMVSPLYSCFEDKNVKLAAQICGVERVEGGFEITIFDPSGFSKIRAKRIVDTTIHKDMIRGKSLNAIVKTDIELEESGIPDRKIVKCTLQKDDDYITARMKLKEELKKGMTADYIAPEFDVTADENILKRGDITCIPSVSYKNPILAFDAGCLLAKEEK